MEGLAEVKVSDGRYFESIFVQVSWRQKNIICWPFQRKTHQKAKVINDCVLKMSTTSIKIDLNHDLLSKIHKAMMIFYLYCKKLFKFQFCFEGFVSLLLILFRRFSF